MGRIDLLRLGCAAALAVGALFAPLSADATCVLDTDCDDGLACTQDSCDNSVCSFSSIPDCVPCDTHYDCAPVDIVFIMDTSGSMRDEAIALCGQIADVVAQLSTLGATVSPTVLGITNTGDVSFACLGNDVVTLLGSSVPGTTDTCAFPSADSSFESWGPATAIVAADFSWTPGSTRIIVPMSDEGPCNGSRPDGCNDPGDDRDSIMNASTIAAGNGVIVSPVTGTGSDSCVVTLAESLANATGGVAIQTTNASTDLATAIRQIVLGTCVLNPSCDDGSVCTDNDTCVSGRCAGTPNFDLSTECCDPSSGSVVVVDDGDVCTNDVCDDGTGVVTHPPADGSVSCDDGDTCTANDVCDGAGGCAGTDINQIACQSDADCFGASCDLGTGYCVCTATPQLCLSVLDPRSGQSCHAVGDTVIIDIELGFSTNVISGADLFFQYDPTVLEFQSIVPGASVDPTSPYALQLLGEVDEIAGTVFYAVGIDLGGFGSQGPTTMARVKFTAIAACQSDELCWLGGNPRRTTLANMMGIVVPFEACCSGDIFINSGDATITCPSSAVVMADPGTAGQMLRWNTVSASSDCQETIDVSCTATQSEGVDIGQLINTGGLFPVGVSDFSCTAVDACGVSSSCAWSVEVDETTPVEVDLEISPQMNSGLDGTTLDRCIEFELFSNCSTAPVVVSQTVHFGPPFNLQGRAVGVMLEVPPGDYQCISARDPLHTVKSVVPMTIIDGRFHASFTGDPVFGGNWLINGNLDGSSAIDVLDFGLFVDFHLTSQDSDTPCGTTGVNADFNGDGFVDTRDWQFIADHLLSTDMVSCCGTTAGAESDSVHEISVAELKATGRGRLTVADLNGDGWVDQSDVALFGTEGFSPKANRKRSHGTRTLRSK